MNPKHDLINILIGPIGDFLESIHITKMMFPVLLNGLVAYLIFKHRKKGDKIKAPEVMITIALMLNLGYAIYFQILILHDLF